MVDVHIDQDEHWLQQWVMVALECGMNGLPSLESRFRRLILSKNFYY